MDRTIAELNNLKSTYDLTDTYVAKAIGVSKATVSLWLKHKYNGDNVKLTEQIKNFIVREKLLNTN